VFDDPDFLKLLRRGSVTLSKEQVDKLFDYLLKAVFPRLKPGQRMLADFSVTDEPDDGTFHKDDLKKNYSLSCEVLLIILEFLHEGKPPIKVM
jgi:hypothetical protein